MGSKYCGGNVSETKEAESSTGVPVGIVSGYLATWDADEGGRWGMPEEFQPGAFKNSIEAFKKDRMKPIPLTNIHGHVIGGFPIDRVAEDGTGLFADGEVNLDLQEGRESYSLAKQKVYDKFSVEWSAIKDEAKDGKRIIHEARIFAAGILATPMNPKANVMEVKSQFQDYPVATQDYEWDEEAAQRRIDDTLLPEAKAALYISGKLIGDIIDHQTRIVPQAVKNAAEHVSQQPEGEDRKQSVRLCEMYLAKLRVESPFSKEEKQYYTVDDLNGLTTVDVETLLLSTGRFSRKATKKLLGRLDVPGATNYASVLAEIKGIKI